MLNRLQLLCMYIASTIPYGGKFWREKTLAICYEFAKVFSHQNFPLYSNLFSMWHNSRSSGEGSAASKNILPPSYYYSYPLHLNSTDHEWFSTDNLRMHKMSGEPWIDLVSYQSLHALPLTIGGKLTKWWKMLRMHLSCFRCSLVLHLYLLKLIRLSLGEGLWNHN